MEKIPITFQYQGNTYTGSLDAIAGAGANVWHLMVNNYYWGRLRRVADRWVFDEGKSGCADLADYFGGVVQQWYG